MRKRNVTLTMPADLIRHAKALAAARGESLSELLRESLEEKVSEAQGIPAGDGPAVEAPCDRVRPRTAGESHLVPGFGP